MNSFYIVSTKELVRINRGSKLLNFNNILDVRTISKLDPDGKHVISISMFFENLGSMRIREHYRCRILLKVKGTMNSLIRTFDCSVADLERIGEVYKHRFQKEIKA